MKCTEIKGLLEHYLDGELPAEYLRSIGGHLETCMTCSTVFEGERAFRSRMKETMARSVAPPGLWERFLARLHTEWSGLELSSIVVRSARLHGSVREGYRIHGRGVAEINAYFESIGNYAPCDHHDLASARLIPELAFTTPDVLPGKRITCLTHCGQEDSSALVTHVTVPMIDSAEAFGKLGGTTPHGTFKVARCDDRVVTVSDCLSGVCVFVTEGELLMNRVLGALHLNIP
jgi:hypothetical protein